AEAGSAPTSTTASPGAARPAFILALTPAVTRPSTSSAILRPSRMRAVMVSACPKAFIIGAWRRAHNGAPRAAFIRIRYADHGMGAADAASVSRQEQD